MAFIIRSRDNPSRLEDGRDFSLDVARKSSSFLLVGAGSYDKFNQKMREAQRVSNSAFLFSPQGKITGRYDKIRLVPFDEYLPLRGYMRWPSWITNSKMTDYLPGKKLTVFKMGQTRFGVLICWENLFPDLFREMTAKGVDFMVSMTNETFINIPSPSAHYQMLAMNVFRAIENRVSILQDHPYRCFGHHLAKRPNNGHGEGSQFEQLKCKRICGRPDSFVFKDDLVYQIWRLVCLLPLCYHRRFCYRANVSKGPYVKGRKPMKTHNKAKRNINSQKVLLAGLVGVALAIQVFFLVNMIMWQSAPNKGWQTSIELGPKIVGATFPLGEKAGLRKGDKILAINGKPYETLDEAIKLTDLQIGHVNVYTIERAEKTLTVSVTTGRLGFKRVFIQSGLFWILGCIFIGLGIIVFLMKPYDRASWAFLAMTASIGIYITYSAPSYFLFRPSWLQNVMILVPPILPAAIIHLTGVFPQQRGFLTKTRSRVIAPYLVSLTLAILAMTFHSGSVLQLMPPLLLNATLFYLFAAVLLFLGSTIYSYMRTTSAAVRLQSIVVLTGIILALFIPMIEILSDLVFKVSIFPNPIFFFLFFLIFFPLSIGYAIVRHDLFEIDMIIRRTYGYILTTGSIAGMYGLFVLLSNVAFEKYEVTKSPMFPLVFILAVVFLFNPIRNRAQKIIDRVFYRLEYDYQEIVQKISETMRSLLNLDQIGKSIMDTALGAMFIDSGCVMLLNKDSKAYECLISAGEREVRRSQTELDKTLPSGEKPIIYEPEKNDKTTPQREASETLESKVLDSRQVNVKLQTDEPFIQKIAERQKEVTVYDIQADPFFEDLRTSCKDTFDQLQATLIVPLIYEDRLTGLISLGDKKSGKFYRQEDINLLNTLANQGAVAIENARMIEEVIEKERMEEELSIARDLQMSMLPGECPTIDGFEIAAYSLSAMEVGGDFYDFIEMGENKAGMVIGDVTGKSVSGALVMSASRSVFRMLSEEDLGVGEIMIRANRRTKKDIKTGMFVALLYAVLNAENRTLSLCSAGQTQPIYWSSETGETKLVETKGDTFPLGILEDVGYQETMLYLVPGDKVVFYTDGIVEAMNEQEEMFGFERLIEIVQEARSMTADSLLKEILDRVNAFAGGAAQHDDLTVIIISADGVKGEKLNVKS